MNQKNAKALRRLSEKSYSTVAINHLITKQPETYRQFYKRMKKVYISKKDNVLTLFIKKEKSGYYED